MADSKQTYIREMEEELKKWDLRMAELKSELKAAAEQHKTSIQSFIDQMAVKKNFAEQKLKDLRKIEGGWEQFKESIDGAASNLDKDYRSALAYTM